MLITRNSASVIQVDWEEISASLSMILPAFSLLAVCTFNTLFFVYVHTLFFFLRGSWFLFMFMHYFVWR